jgi:hypothetical protein
MICVRLLNLNGVLMMVMNGQCFGRVSNAYLLLELTFAVTVQRMQLKKVLERLN